MFGVSLRSTGVSVALQLGPSGASLSGRVKSYRAHPGPFALGVLVPDLPFESNRGRPSAAPPIWYVGNAFYCMFDYFDYCFGLCY